MKIGIYGLGKLGLPLAVVFAEAGHDVIGTDINPKIIKAINDKEIIPNNEEGLDELLKKVYKTNKLIAMPFENTVKNSDIHIITIPFYKQGDKERMDKLLVDINQRMKKEDIIVIETTLPMDYTINKKINIAVAPEQTMTGTTIKDIKGEEGYCKSGETIKMKKVSRVIGVSDKRIGDVLKRLYGTITKEVFITDIKTAMLTKILYGVYRDEQIAMANEFSDICRDYGVEFNTVRNLINETPLFNLPNSGIGVGGHCIPIYPSFIEVYPLKDMARFVNKCRPSVAVNLLEKETQLHKKNVLLFGLSYRGNIKADENSIAYPLKDMLENSGAKGFLTDYFYTDKEIEKKGFTPFTNPDKTKVDIVIIVTDHRMFKYFNFDIFNNPNLIILDGRHMIEKSKYKLIRM